MRRGNAERGLVRPPRKLVAVRGWAIVLPEGGLRMEVQGPGAVLVPCLYATRRFALMDALSDERVVRCTLVWEYESSLTRPGRERSSRIDPKRRT